MDRVEIQVGDRPIRDVHEEIHAACADGKAIRLSEPLSRHNLCIGLPASADIEIAGSAGYYCGGLNDGGTVRVERNAGWALGEGMNGGLISVDGYAGYGAGAAMIDGVIHIKGDTGPRVGVAMKGGTIVVEGKIGYQSGFMAHAGKIIALGGAGESTGDALWRGEVWVCGEVENLGVDAVVTEPNAKQVAEVDAILEPMGLADKSRDWKRIVAGERLWYFESRDAGAWLMI